MARSARRVDPRSRLGTWLLVSGLVLGSIVRLAYYIGDRSLTMDESFLALNIIDRGSAELLETLHWNSGAPILFLLIEEVLTDLLGSSEAVLRLYPFLSSMAALALFAAVAKRMLSRLSAGLAVLYFASFPVVVEYAGIAKQYSSDAAVGLLILALALRVLDSSFALSWIIGLAGVGLVVPLLSHTGAFYLVAALVSLAGVSLRSRDRRAIFRTAGVLAVWTIAAAAAFATQRGKLETLRGSWAGAYLDSLQVAKNALGQVREVIGVQSASGRFIDVGDVLATLLAISLVLGAVGVFRRRAEHGLLLLLPLLAGAVASLLGYYPLSTRTLVFSAPILALLAAEGFGVLGRHLRSFPLRVVVVVVALAVPAYAVLQLAQGMPLQDDGVRSSMVRLAQLQRNGDSVFVHFAAQYPFAYYLSCDCAPSGVRDAVATGLWDTHRERGSVDQFAPALASSARFEVAPFRGWDLSNISKDLDHLRGKGRVWVLTTFLRPEDRATFVRMLDRDGRQMRAFGTGDRLDASRLYLYDFE